MGAAFRAVELQCRALAHWSHEPGEGQLQPDSARRLEAPESDSPTPGACDWEALPNTGSVRRKVEPLTPIVVLVRAAGTAPWTLG